MKKIMLCAFYLGIFLLMAIAQGADAKVIQDKAIYDQEVWSTSGSPYIVEGNIDVFLGGKLTIEPGTEVRFESGKIHVFGTLIIDGNESKKIKLYNNGFNVPITIDGGSGSVKYVDATGGQKLMNVFSGGNVQIANTTFTNANGSGSYISAFGNSSIDVNDSEFKNIELTSALEVFNGSALALKNSVFTGMASSHSTHVSVFDTDNRHTEAQILNSDFSSGKKGIEVYGGAFVKVESSSIKNFSESGVSVFDRGSVDIASTTISNNETAINAYNSSTTVRASNLEHNHVGVSSNEATISAQNNWWGDAKGPLNQLHNPQGVDSAVSDDSDITPWSTSKFNYALETPCCSNVLFIPGVEGSRLYKMEGSRENQLWEPNRNLDVQKLFLSEGGESLDSSVYTKDIINRTNVIGSLFSKAPYEDFSRFLDGLKAQKVINDWQAAPYDWRLSINDTVSKGILLKNNERVFIQDQIVYLAAHSKSKKVTIVAHSNGGMLTKALVNDLIKSGRDSLIDKIIFVAVPEYGTPAAIAGLLHGDDLQLLNGVILKKSTARQLAEHMPSAFSLLPTAKYYEKSIDPVVIKFNSDSPTSTATQMPYGSTIRSTSSLRDFLTDVKNDRLKNNKNKSDIDWPNVLNSNLLNQSEELHRDLDAWVPPSDIKLTTITATGKDTVKGVEYFQYDCKTNNSITDWLIKNNCGANHPYRLPIISKNGDGSVMFGGTAPRAKDSYVVDLYAVNNDEHKNYDHVTIMNVPSVDEIIRKEIFRMPIDVVNHVSPLDSGHSLSTQNSSTSLSQKFSVFSPVSILAVDSEGRTTGLTKEENDFGYVIKDIPNSSYFSVGEGKVLQTSEPIQKLILKGTDTGTFTLKIENQSFGSMETSIFKNLPVTSEMSAELIFATSSPILKIDRDSDGKIDEEVLPTASSTPSFQSILVQQKETIGNSTTLSTFMKTYYLGIINKIEKQVVLGKKGEAQNISEKNLKVINRTLSILEYQQKRNKRASKVKLQQYILLYGIFTRINLAI